MKQKNKSVVDNSSLFEIIILVMITIIVFLGVLFVDKIVTDKNNKAIYDKAVYDNSMCKYTMGQVIDPSCSPKDPTCCVKQSYYENN